MRFVAVFVALFVFAVAAQAQIQVELKFKRLQYIAYEPVFATIKITNFAGRDIDLHDDNDQTWFGFEVTQKDGEVVVPNQREHHDEPLHIVAGQTVTRKINLVPLFPVHDYGVYHIRANVFFPDLNKFFYSQTKVFQVTDARPIWQKTVGVPLGMVDAGGVRTYSLLSNRFPDHTSLYVRVEDKESSVVYNTFPLGHIIAFDQPQAELDRMNQLHVLFCSAPRTWAYAHVGVDGRLLAHSTFMETKSRPKLSHTTDGSIAVRGGMLDVPVAQSARAPVPKLSARPPDEPIDD